MKVKNYYINEIKICTISLIFIFFNCENTKPSHISSPINGSVPYGEKAYSPNGKMYAREFIKNQAEKNKGYIGIFDSNTKKLNKIIDVKQYPILDVQNHIKALAWSPDSKQIAVVFHYDLSWINNNNDYKAEYHRFFQKEKSIKNDNKKILGHVCFMDIESTNELKVVYIDGYYHDIRLTPEGDYVLDKLHISK